MNRALLKFIIKNMNSIEDHTEFFAPLIEDINKVAEERESLEFLNESKEMEIWEKISNAQISENPKAVYPKDIFIKDVIDLEKIISKY